jgi:hypothetical protein
MPLVHIKSFAMPAEQKLRLGQRIINAFGQEGIPTSSVILLFGREEGDLLLEDGLLFEMAATPVAASRTPAALPPAAPVSPSPAAPVEAPAPPDFKNKLRRSKAELVDLKQRLVRCLQKEGALSSFRAQEELGLKTCDWAPATLRRFFSELEEDGSIIKQGQKRGTRYVWKGIATQQPPPAAQARLVKRVEDEAEAGGGA